MKKNKEIGNIGDEMKCIERISRLEGDGYAEERKFERVRNGSIAMEYKIETNLVPFAMDIEKRKSVVFSITRKAFNIYVLVVIANKDFTPKVRVFTAGDLFHWIGPEMDVSGKWPEEALSIALSVLESVDTVELSREIIEILDRTNGDSAKRAKSIDQYFQREVKRAKAESKGIIRM